MKEFIKETIIAPVLSLLIFLGACSVNPATGEQQFTALMPASSEASVGAQEHAKVEQTFGKFIQGPLQSYVNSVGQRVAKNTERPDVQYKFYVIDSPIVNAFALPGGYVYVTRGILALANNEAELAAVLGHEIAHVTARHSAERVSQGFLAQLGAVVLASAVNSPNAAKAANLGSNLYISSYSRGQESEADQLGVRYLSRAGYDTFSMSSFLNSMAMSSNLEAKVAGKNAQRADWFSSHPQTEGRVNVAAVEAGKFSAGQATTNRDGYLNAINGMVYGDSAAQGFIKGQSFYHTDIGFMFSFPAGFVIENQPDQVVGVHKGSGAVILFDAAGDANKSDPFTYLTRVWLKGEPANNPESITINGMRAATAGFPGMVNGRSVTVQLVAIEWEPGKYFRYQIAIPQGIDAESMDALKKTTYSFRRLSASERNSIKPQSIRIITAGAGDSVASLAARMPFDTYREERFRVLNGLGANEQVKAGQKYKTVVE